MIRALKSIRTVNAYLLTTNPVDGFTKLAPDT
jgi:hypothetical protein